MDADGLKDLFEPFGRSTVETMFGGHGVYADGLCFAIQTDGDRLSQGRRPRRRRRSPPPAPSPFTYVAKGKPMKMAYWRLVDRPTTTPRN